jgi:high-affinity nickel permease
MNFVTNILVKLGILREDLDYHFVRTSMVIIFLFFGRSSVWHGFDTATEIGLLGISAREATKGVSFNAILVFPMLFAAGMSLIDTTDNILMLGAYIW